MSGYCGAKTRSGRPCQQKAMAGGKRCYVHGGKSPQALAAAQRRLAEQRAQRYLEDLGDDVRPVTDPIAELERLAGMAVALVEALRPIVADLESVRANGGLGGESVRGEIQAYMGAIARAESILGRIMSLDLDSRRLRLDAARVELTVEAFWEVLRLLDLSEEDQRRGSALFASKLRRERQPVLEARQ